MFAGFLEKLRDTPDGDGSLLDHSLIFYGGGMGNPNQHAAGPLPMVVAGGGLAGVIGISNLAGWHAGGQSVADRGQQFDNPMEKFGESKGTIDLF